MKFSRFINVIIPLLTRVVFSWALIFEDALDYNPEDFNEPVSVDTDRDFVPPVLTKIYESMTQSQSCSEKQVKAIISRDIKKRDDGKYLISFPSQLKTNLSIDDISYSELRLVFSNKLRNSQYRALHVRRVLLGSSIRLRHVRSSQFLVVRERDEKIWDVSDMWSNWNDENLTFLASANDEEEFPRLTHAFVISYQKASKSCQPHTSLIATETRTRSKRGASYERSCHLSNMFLNFTEIGWDSWIIAPSGMKFSVCSGGCLPKHSTTVQTSYSIALSLLHQVGHKSAVPKSSCVPSKLGSVLLVYKDIYVPGRITVGPHTELLAKDCRCT